MNYSVSPAKLQELNVIVGQQGGTIPTEVSNALAATQTAIAAGDTAGATQHLNEAIAANKKNGAAWSHVQRWHNDVRDGPLCQFGPPGPTGPGPTGGTGSPPPVSVPPGLQPPLGPSETRRLIGDENILYWITVQSEGYVSTALGSGGVQICGSPILDAQPDPNDQKWTMGGSGWAACSSGTTMSVRLKPGQYLAWKFSGAAQQEMRPQVQNT